MKYTTKLNTREKILNAITWRPKTVSEISRENKIPTAHTHKIKNQLVKEGLIKLIPKNKKSCYLTLIQTQPKKKISNHSLLLG